MLKRVALDDAVGRVHLIAASRETLRGLQGYLDNVGIAAQTGRRLALPYPQQATALIIFPDDFVAGRVLAFLRRIRSVHPELPLVTVTSQMSLYCRATTADGAPMNLTVLARPSFGWTILDAIRERG